MCNDRLESAAVQSFGVAAVAFTDVSLSAASLAGGVLATGDGAPLVRDLPVFTGSAAILAFCPTAPVTVGTVIA